MSQPDDAAFFTADFTALPAEQMLKKWRQQVLDSERDRAAYIQASAFCAFLEQLCLRHSTISKHLLLGTSNAETSTRFNHLSDTLQVLRSLLADADTATATAAATGAAAPREGRTSSEAGSSASAAEGSLLAAGTVAEQQQRRAAVDARRHELQYLQGEGASLAALALAQVRIDTHQTSLFVLQRFASVVCTYEAIGTMMLGCIVGVTRATALSTNLDGLVGTTKLASTSSLSFAQACSSRTCRFDACLQQPAAYYIVSFEGLAQASCGYNNALSDAIAHAAMHVTVADCTVCASTASSLLGLTDVEQRLELELLRLSRALDRERLVELLKATDPDPPSPKSKCEARTAAAAELISPLHCCCHNLRLLLLYEQERSLREHDARDTGTAHTREIAKLQAELKKTEDSLGQTVLDALELRHNALRTQRAAAEERGMTQSLLLRLRAEAAAAKDRLAREKAAHIANAAPAVQ
eukprot:15637-Heterococcus_DN1.PRE.1